MHVETPLVYSPLMSSRLGYEVYLKLENLQLSQSFKYRGISLFVSQAVKEHGPDVHMVAATSGNAGIALALVGQALNVCTSIFIPTTATIVQSELETAGARVVVGGADYADAFLAAQHFCGTTPKAVLMSSYDHPTLWEGHSTMIHEIGRQLPGGIMPDAIFCNVGGGGLLGGVLRGVNDLGWDRTKIVAIETHGSNCYHLSMLANSPSSTSVSLIPKDVALIKTLAITRNTNDSRDLFLAKLPAITSEASSLGARSPAQTTVESGLTRRAQAVENPEKFGGLTSVTVPDEVAMHAALGFLDEQKLLVEIACGATLSPAYVPGLLDTLAPKDLTYRPIVIFIVCGGSKATFEDAKRHHSIIQTLGTDGLNLARQNIIIDSSVGLA